MSDETKTAPETVAGDRGDRGAMTTDEPKKGPLPEDFPGRAALEAAGITSYGKLRNHKGELTEIDGIGEATAAKISAAMGETTGDDSEDVTGKDEADSTAATDSGVKAPEPPVGETGAQAESRIRKELGTELPPVTP